VGFWDFWTADAKDYVFGQLNASQGPPGTASVAINADTAYVEVTLRRLWIPKIRIGTKKFYGAVHSDLGLWHESGDFVNFKHVITPDELKDQDVDAKHLDRAIVSNQPILGPTPYRGGRLQFNLALLSIKAEDLAGPFLEVLSGLAGAAGVSFVGAAQPFLKPLATGIDLLTGTSGAAVREIQVMTNLQPVLTGVFVVVRATKNEVDLQKIRVESDYTLRDANQQPLTAYPYMVATIERADSRADWAGIPDVKTAYERVKTAVRNDKPEEYRDAMTVFRRTCMLSPDLLSSHARKLVKEVQSKMDELMGAPLTSGTQEKRQVPNLDSFEPF
jgi:hypothetical protein